MKIEGRYIRIGKAYVGKDRKSAVWRVSMTKVYMKVS